MDKLLSVLAEATSGLVEWAPSQLGPLVEMQQAWFSAAIPIFRWVSILAAAIIIATAIVNAMNDCDDWPFLVYFVVGIALVVGVVGLSIVSVDYRIFKVQPELYVLKALLGK